MYMLILVIKFPVLSLHFHYLISNQEYNFECINFVLRKYYQSVFEFISIYGNHQKYHHTAIKKKFKKEKQSWQTSHSYAKKAEKQSN